MKFENFPTRDGWKRVGTSPHHGIDVPLSALHTKKSAGIGEFLDLIPLIDWCHSVDLDVIQLLPLNDSGDDPSPYNALSSQALNPLFISLHALPVHGKNETLATLFSELQTYTLSPRVQYSLVKKKKMEWLRLYFERFARNSSLEPFKTENPWLVPYALFKTLKEKHPHTAWKDWPVEYQTLSPTAFKTLATLYQEEINFYIWLQQLCYTQMREVKKHAESKAILLHGDLPILISPDSVDVWHHRHLFDLSLSAGAPPDSYSEEGQYWGFPLFNWKAMQSDNFQWWKDRIGYAAHFYDIYRIDHVVGLFRIWAIPPGKAAKEGFFVPQNRSLWTHDGNARLLAMIEASSMLPNAEDLGTVPCEVHKTLQKLGICGTKVIRWERYWETTQEFIPYSEYPILSLTCLSTHDTETLAQWWKNNPDEASLFASFKGWCYASELTFAERLEILRDSHQTPSLFHINLLQEYLALFPELVSSNPDDERINIPGKLLSTNWTYRFTPNLERLTGHAPLRSAMNEII
jgi:4-alpha-glucanotransferase